MSRFENNIFGLVAKKDILQIGYDVVRPNDPVDQLIDDLNMASVETQMQIDALEARIKELEAKLNG